MSDRHDPRTCHLCRDQARELRHPSYARTRRALFIPNRRKQGALS